MKASSRTCLLYIIAFGLIIIFGRCGGGSDIPAISDSQSSAGKIFTLLDPDRWESGYTRSMSLTGSDSHGNDYELSATATVLDETTYEEQAVIPVQEMDVLKSLDEGWIIAHIGTTYYDADTKDPIIRIDEEGNEDIPITISHLPETAETGDFGSLTSWQMSDGSYYTENWELEDAGGGLANLIIYRIVKDSDGDITGTRELAWTIDENGTIYSVSAVIYFVDSNLTLELSGTETRSAAQLKEPGIWDYDRERTVDNELLKNLISPFYTL